MIHAAVYARFSTDKQRETSIEDQARVCRARIDAAGWHFVETFSDMETSGRTLISDRPGAARLIDAVSRGLVNVVVIESLDRLARDLVEQETVVRRLEHRGLRIICVSDGYDTELQGRELMRAVRGAINEGYIRDLSHKTHRGLAGQVERGYHAGGLSFGYRSVVAGTDARGEPIGHRLEVDNAHATIVQLIFERYADGWSCQKIAAALNAEGVPGPRGGTWCVSALYGSPNKGSGVLNNELYLGRYIWNRSQWLKDPDTRKRVRMDRPRVEWVIEERPELRILDDALWQRSRDRMARRPRPGQRAPRSLFGGLLKCGKCGGAVIIVNATTYGCAARKDRGATVCGGLYISRMATDGRLLSLIRDELMSPAAIIELRELAAEALAAQQSDTQVGVTRRRLSTLEREIGNLTNAIAECGMSQALKTKLEAAENERQALTRAQTDMRPLPAPDALVAQYKRLAMDFKGALKDDIPRARQILADTGMQITLNEKGAEIWAEVATSAGRLLMAAGSGIASDGCGDPLSQVATIRIR